MRIKAWEELAGCGDNHGDKENAPTVKKFLSFVEQYKPKHRLHLGDCWDFRPLRKKADECERKESMEADYATGKEFLKQYRPTVFLRGNHDERLWDLAEDAEGLIGDYSRKAVKETEQFIAKLGCEMRPYDREIGVWKMGNHAFLHGYACGEGAAKKHALTYLTNVVFAHVHGPNFYQASSMGGVSGRSISCLCEKRMKYNRSHLATFRQRNGWIYGAANKYTGEVLIYDAVERDGKFICATELIEL